jgi:Fuc2NAc and GlcNAc transferase
MTLILSGFLLGFAGSWLMVQWGEHVGTIDMPSDRSSHSKAIPKGAGFGILAALLLSSLILKIHWMVWFPATVISLASFWGADKHILPVSIRLMIHFGCALFFLIFFLASKQASMCIYFVWLPALVFVVGTANFFNFMDGIDGIAGICGFVAFLLMAYYARFAGFDPAYTSLSMVIAFSCLGFLCLNIPKARVFLGDVGSILLGFVFACLVVFLSKNVTDFLVMAGFLSLFYMDELFTMVVRIRHKDSLITPHRKHIYQLLANEAGMNHFKISLGYGLVQLVIGVSAIAIQPKGAVFLLGIYLFYGFIFAVFSIVVRKELCPDEK